jgi:hypothetical protein
MDDVLYYGTDITKVREFEEQLGKRFSLELLGNAHWYLGSRINQLEKFDIEIDQLRYCRGIKKKYLETAGCAYNIKQHKMPLPSGFIPTADVCVILEDESQ